VYFKPTVALQKINKIGISTMKDIKWQFHLRRSRRTILKIQKNKHDNKYYSRDYLSMGKYCSVSVLLCGSADESVNVGLTDNLAMMIEVFRSRATIFSVNKNPHILKYIS